MLVYQRVNQTHFGTHMRRQIVADHTLWNVSDIIYVVSMLDSGSHRDIQPHLYSRCFLQVVTCLVYHLVWKVKHSWHFPFQIRRSHKLALENKHHPHFFCGFV